jgi:hypothetical protein
MQQRLKSVPRSTRAGIIPTKLLDQLFLTAYDAIAPFDMGLRRETLATFANDLESTRIRGVRS